jgi:hypothetical protein
MRSELCFLHATRCQLQHIIHSASLRKQEAPLYLNEDAKQVSSPENKDEAKKMAEISLRHVSFI